MRFFRAYVVGAMIGFGPFAVAGADPGNPTVTVTIDLSAVHGDRAAALANATRAQALLGDLRERHDLTRFEFTRAVRIAPFRIPHSHPVLTLNTRWVDDDTRFLATYLHEQIHWYLSDHRRAAVAHAIEVLKKRYPAVPSAESQRARDTYSIYLHLIVNWLEIAASGALIGLDEAKALFDEPAVYPWIYRTVIRDWESIGGLLKDVGIVPMPDARSVTRGPG